MLQASTTIQLDGPQNKRVGPGDRNREALGLDHKETKPSILWSYPLGLRNFAPTFWRDASMAGDGGENQNDV